jgi:hypothetical protein
MDVKTSMQMARPYNPVTVELEADEELEASYAVWNLLNQSEEDMPLLSTADWLKFVVGMSSISRRLLSNDVLRMEDVF